NRFIGRLDGRIRELSKVALPRLGDGALVEHLGRVTRLLEDALRMHVLGSAMAGGHYLLLKKFLKAAGVAEEENVVDELLAGAPGIETARSNAALYDLALTASALPAVREALLGEEPAAALARLGAGGVAGGAEFRSALDRFLEEFG